MSKTIPNFLSNGDVFVGEKYVGRIDSDGDFKPAVATKNENIGSHLKAEIRRQMEEEEEDNGYDWTRDQLLFAGIEK